MNSCHPHVADPRHADINTRAVRLARAAALRRSFKARRSPFIAAQVSAAPGWSPAACFTLLVPCPDPQYISRVLHWTKRYAALDGIPAFSFSLEQGERACQQPHVRRTGTSRADSSPCNQGARGRRFRFPAVRPGEQQGVAPAPLLIAHGDSIPSVRCSRLLGPDWPAAGRGWLTAYKAGIAPRDRLLIVDCLRGRWRRCAWRSATSEP